MVASSNTTSTTTSSAMLAVGLTALSVVAVQQLVSAIYASSKNKQQEEEEGGKKLASNVVPVPVNPSGVIETLTMMSGGNAPFFLLDMHKALNNSPVFKLNMPFIPKGWYVIGDATIQREVLTDPTSEKPRDAYGSFSSVGGAPNVFTRSTTDPVWRDVRKATAHAFSNREVSRMNDICKKQVQLWIEQRLEPFIKNDQPFDPCEEMTRLTFKIIMEAAFEYDASTDEDFDIYIHNADLALKETLKQTIPLRGLFGFMIPEVRKARKAAKEGQEFAYKLLLDYRSKPESVKSSNNTLIKLIEEKSGLGTDDRLKVSEMVTFIGGGYDTTGYTLGNTLVLLSKNLHYQDKARELLKSTNGDASRGKNYIRQVISESNRFMPVGALGSIRSLGRDLTVQSKDGTCMIVPKGATLFLPHYLAHHNEVVFPEPDIFNPDRWDPKESSEEQVKLMQKNLLTFALGNRNCVGQALATSELNCVLPALLEQYEFELVDEGQLDYFLTLKFDKAMLKAKRISK